MNTLYFKYALEVEKTASITQAADNLFMTQPTLSKSIKDLESLTLKSPPMWPSSIPSWQRPCPRSSLLTPAWTL